MWFKALKVRVKNPKFLMLIRIRRYSWLVKETKDARALALVMQQNYELLVGKFDYCVSNNRHRLASEQATAKKLRESEDQVRLLQRDLALTHSALLAVQRELLPKENS